MMFIFVLFTFFPLFLKKSISGSCTVKYFVLLLYWRYAVYLPSFIFSFLLIARFTKVCGCVLFTYLLRMILRPSTRPWFSMYYVSVSYKYIF